LRHGFKALAERSSRAAREALGIDSIAPLDPWRYAAHLGVLLLDFETLGLKPNTIKQLTVNDPESWSALTIQEGATLAIVINPAHTLARQRADLTHELAHVDLKHKPARVEVSSTGVLLLSDYNDEQEQEADWLAATLLVPREGLVQMRARHATVGEIATHYGVSERLSEWRLRMTGVDIQLRRAGSRR
jgi:hypothetical protein